MDNGTFHVDGTNHRVGIGTTIPSDKLTIHNGQLKIFSTNLTKGLPGIILDTTTNSPIAGKRFSIINQYDHLSVFNDTDSKILLYIGDNVGIGNSSPGFPLEMGSGAHVTAGGVWTNASSREYKENIRDLTVEEAMTALRELQPTRFNYKVDKQEECVGFIAEDVPELLANKDRNGLSPMDIVAVLTKVVQEQQKKIEALEARLNAGQ